MPHDNHDNDNNGNGGTTPMTGEEKLAAKLIENAAIIEAKLIKRDEVLAKLDLNEEEADALLNTYGVEPLGFDEYSVKGKG